MPTTALATTPVAVDTRLSWMIHLAWILPALTVAVRKAYVIAWHPTSVAPTMALVAILCVSWTVLASLPAWRGLLRDIGRLILAKVCFVPLLLVTCVMVLLGSSHALDSLWV